MSQSDLAIKLCLITETSTITRAEVSRWERGKRRPSDWLPALAQALGADLAELERLPQSRLGISAGITGSDVRSFHREDEWEVMAAMLRRTFLTKGITAAALPVVGVAELQHIAAALEDARKYADRTLVGYFRRRLDEVAAADRTVGPAGSVPAVLGLIGAVERTASAAKPAVREELLRVAARAAELAAWLYRDAAVLEAAAYWRDRAMEWAQAGADPAMQGYILLKKAQAAWDDRDGLRMLTLAQAAQNGPWALPPRVQAEVAQQAARGRAMLGDDHQAVATELGRACELFAHGDDAAGLSPHYDAALFEVQVAATLALVGRPDKALEVYEQWLTPRLFSHRDYGYFLSFKSEAQLKIGDVETAADTGLEALTIARSTGSARTHAALIRLVGDLRQHWARPQVRALRDEILLG